MRHLKVWRCVGGVDIFRNRRALPHLSRAIISLDYTPFSGTVYTPFSCSSRESSIEILDAIRACPSAELTLVGDHVDDADLGGANFYPPWSDLATPFSLRLIGDLHELFRSPGPLTFGSPSAYLVSVLNWLASRPLISLSLPHALMNKDISQAFAVLSPTSSGSRSPPTRPHPERGQLF